MNILISSFVAMQISCPVDNIGKSRQNKHEKAKLLIGFRFKFLGF